MPLTSSDKLRKSPFAKWDPVHLAQKLTICKILGIMIYHCPFKPLTHFRAFVTMPV